jgi:cytochrome c biogenesis protein CcmG, thiol:disulfide interchange protein DsbE
MQSSRPSARRLFALAGLSLAFLPMLAMAPKISREGDGPHREKMSALESQPVPAEFVTALDGLADWLNEPVGAEVFGAGGVVAIAFIDSGNGASMTMLNSLTRLMRQKGEDGLTVFAVHGQEGWDKVEQLSEDGRIRVSVVKDDGSLAAALGVDDDPDVFLIDRAGLLRYADIHSRSVDAGISTLLRETPELAAQNAAKEAQIRRIAMEEDGPASERATTSVGATKADPKAYAEAAWPAHNGGEIYATNFQGRTLPVRLGGEQWITQKQDLTGKVIVLDFWAVWCGPCKRAMPGLDALQKSNTDDLAVLGIGGQSESIDTVRSYVEKSNHSYGQLFDARQRIYKAMSVRAIPHAVVLSSDGVIRWQGNPLDANFQRAVNQVLAVDPGISRNLKDD